jgi:ABC-type multidrug transport system ATPase subunit/ABC-type multidrug transport system permease subunit
MSGSKQHQTIISTNPYLQLNNQGKILPPLQLKTNQHLLGRDCQKADLLVPDDWQVISGCHALLRKEGEQYRIYDGDGHNPSRNGLFLNHTRITTTEGYLLQDGTQIQIGQNPQNQILLTYFNPNQQQFLPPTQRTLSLKQRNVVIGRDADASLQLDAPTVSRRHATIDTNTQGSYILQDHSTNGVFVNGQRVTNSIQLPVGATIRIGPFTLILRGDKLVLLDRGDQIRLDAYNLVIEDKSKRRLDDITLAIEPGQFVALVGGSGAGKSTLMRTLLGTELTTSGEVHLNGENLRTNFNIYRTQIGYVPQDDIIHRQLTVAEALTYAAQLRLPPDTDIKSVLEKTLSDVEMSHRRNALVSELSGGQRKRVSIGVELLADPKLFFLDEPTSGLDPGLDKKMMQLLRRLADQGRTVILVTHATANITLCDRVVFLGQGGRLCYFGPPKDSLKFFGVKTGDFADIYNELENEPIVIQEAKRFNNPNCPDYKQYITNHLSHPNTQQSTHNSSQKVKQNPVKQLTILTKRYFDLTRRDRVNLALALLTAPIGISLIPLAIRDKNPLILGSEADPSLAPLALRVLFVFTCAAIWVGLSTALQEVVKEAAIYLRERLVNLGLIPYLGSKILILGGLALLQTLLMVGVIIIGFKSPEPSLISWQIGVAITSFLTLLTSVSLGLMVSSIVKNSAQANSALPLLLLPQIIFSGVLFKMEGIAKYFSWMMLSRWSVGAYGSLVNVNAMVPAPTKLPNGTTITQPFEVTPVYDLTWHNLNLNWGVLLLHTTVYLVVTWCLQKRKDIF